MDMTHYSDLLNAARQQSEPQRLLFVFTQPELPDGYTDAKNQDFHAGTGGVLTPKMCTDKALDEPGDFSDLVAESHQMGQDWKIVFIACLAGRAGAMPSTEEAQTHLTTMVNSIQNGVISKYLAYDQDGNLVRFS
ncbi:MAG TPA: ribonucleotide reductase subunit alpha [Thiobacillus sp.]|nr:ribonucleotide reductase subunit alpha [Thiobacillus sp.]